jgi:steroid 5-alpha reductase family enzyme
MQEMSLVLIAILLHGTLYFTRRDQRLDYIDIAWGLGFVLIAWAGFFTHIFTRPKLILVAMVSAWGLRLAYYFFERAKKGEDHRYLEFKKLWGENWLKESYKKLFLIQALLLFFISQPIQLGITGLWDHFQKNHFIGMFLFLLGFLLQIYSDYSLKKFKTSHPNKILNEGLWKWCRHPNYLGEIILWWGFYFYILNVWSAWTMISPLLLTYYLIKVNGIPQVEKELSHLPGYENYVASTPRLLPMKVHHFKNLWSSLRLGKNAD